MKLFDELNDDNFVLFAARSYYNPRCIDAEEFYEDLHRFKYLKRLLNKYKQSGSLSERLILNHVTIILNVFGIPEGKKMLVFKLGEHNLPVIKPFLVFLRAIEVEEFTGIHMDQVVVDALRQI